jgi:hypothetical protein
MRSTDELVVIFNLTMGSPPPSSPDFKGSVARLNPFLLPFIDTSKALRSDPSPFYFACHHYNNYNTLTYRNFLQNTYPLSGTYPTNQHTFPKQKPRQMAGLWTAARRGMQLTP